jgi:hypothetical protein
MDVGDPQFLYMALILPSLFGLTLMGEGMTRIMRSQMEGWLSVVVGMGFIGVVVAAYMVLGGIV